jgi:hypothetical protein
MTRPIGTPETSGEAICITHALTDPDIEPRLVQDFGNQVVGVTRSNAHAWMRYTVAQGFKAAGFVPYGPVEQVARVPLGPDDTGYVAEEEQEDVYPDPAAFDVEQSTVILRAMRHMALARNSSHQGDRRRALDYLATHSPNRVERLLSGLTLTATVKALNQGLVQYTYARITRGRNRSNRFAAATTEPPRQIGHA